MDTAVILAIFGILSLIISVVIVGLFKLITDSNKNNEKLSTALDSLVKVHQENAKQEAENSRLQTEAVIRTADEAKERNGHLGELIVQSSEATKSLADTATKQVIQAIKTQTVEEQKVKHQTIESSDEVK